MRDLSFTELNPELISTDLQTISYDATVSVKERACINAKANAGFVNELSFELDGFTKDRLHVKVRCEECACEKVDNSPLCNLHGNLACGGCECHKGVRAVMAFEFRLFDLRYVSKY